MVLFIRTPDAVHPLAIEYEADDATADVVLDDGEGYVSANGFEWENVRSLIVIFCSASSASAIRSSSRSTAHVWIAGSFGNNTHTMIMRRTAVTVANFIAFSST